MTVVARIGALVGELLEISGDVPTGTPLLDLGADSLVLIELSHRVEQEFGVEISVQQLFEDVVTVDAVARWIEQEGGAPTAAPDATGIAAAQIPADAAVTPAGPVVSTSRIGALVGELLEISGDVPTGTPLLDLGADSLVLIELSHRVEQEFGVEISVQQLFEDVVTVDAVARWIEQEGGTPTAAPDTTVPAPAAPAVPEPVASTAPAPAAPAVPEPDTTAPAPAAPAVPEPVASSVPAPDSDRDFAEATAASLRLSERFQDVLCNNRRFAERDEKERAGSYPIWVTESDGPYVRDADGNRLIDIAMGYGSHLFGHSPAFVTEALRRQLDRGIHLGAEIAGTGELARKITTLTGVERVNFCVTGTEAVFTAVRLARAYTGRPKVLLLKNAYHGHSDATLYGPRPGGRTRRAATPNAPGVSRSGAEDVLIGSVDDPELSRFLLDNADDIAAVVMEPLQNGSPDRDLGELAAEMRRVTQEAGILLVFDEVLTGFRFAPGGFQELYGVRADLVTYGKTVGAGLPISVVAGRADIMDLVDGGPWTQDLRVPSDRLTYTAGTYVKHPLAVAAANAVMDELIARGPQFQTAMNERGDRLRARIDAVLNEAGTGVRVIGRGTAFRFVRADSTSFAFIGSDFHQFRRNLIAEGVYITETGLSYVSDAHTDEVLDEIVAAVGRAVRPRPPRTVRPRPPRTVRPAETPSPRAATVPATGREAAGPAVAVSDAAGSDSAAREVAAARPLAVSLAFFGMQDSAHGGNFYDTVTGLAEAAEAGGLDALWFPERHFDRFAGFSPNPAVLAALVAARTHRIALRAGSAVLPLHPPVTVAEDWAMLDVASGGRVGLAVASGWMRRDFVLSDAPYEARRDLFEQRITEITRLWAGEKVRLESPAGTAAEVELFPKPVQRELPLWQAVLGDERSFRQAGRAGRNILTNLIQQDLQELKSKLRVYREARGEAGLDPDGGQVTVLVHTAYTPDEETREAAVRDLESYMLQTFRSTHPDPASLDTVDWTPRTRAAAQRLMDGLSLIGDQDAWDRQCRALREAGATEISCLIDFTTRPESWRPTVEALTALRERIARPEQPAPTPPALTAAAPAPAQAQAPTPVTGRDVALTRGAVEIWAASKSSPNAMAAYTIQRLFEIRGRVDLQRLGEAFRAVMRHDPALRLAVRTAGDGGVIPEFSTEHQDAFVLYDGIATDQDAFCDRVAADLAATPLDPERSPGIVLRCQPGADGVFLHLAASHAIIDGTQFSEILTQVGQVYAGGTELPGLPARAPVDTSKGDRDRAFWRETVARIPRRTLDQALGRPVFDRSWRGRRLSRRLPADWLDAVKAQGRRHRVTPFVETLATTVESLDAFSRRPLLYSFPALRPRTEEYGSNANLLPLWADTASGDLRAHCRSAVLDGLRHGSLTFTQIFESETAGDPERRRVMPDVTFAWDHFDSMRLGEAAIRELPQRTEVVRFPLAVTFTVEPGDTVTLSLDVGEWMDEGTAEKCFESLHTSLTERYGVHPAAAPRPEEPAPPTTGPLGTAEAFAHAAAAAVRTTGDDWVRALRLDGQEHLAGLIVSKARATAAAVLERCDVSRVTGVRIAADREQDLVGAVLVSAMLGLADRVAEEKGDGVLLEIRATSSGRESSDDRVVVGMSAWTYVEADAPLPVTPSGPAAVTALLDGLTARHGAGRTAVLDRAAAVLAERTGTAQGSGSAGRTGTAPSPGSAGQAATAPAPGSAEQAAPAPGLRAVVRTAWEKALARTGFGADEDFFDLGGDSIAAIRVVAELNSRLGGSLPVNLVYLHPTVDALASALDTTPESERTDDSHAPARG
ncbi:MupA/Atu3671 family FMN-dependent luciferase-like monooxygenase [Streptomyces zhihengii]|uniref:MupA/Atu3671 family FMN-dependent luciferase-like monooxygenase n=1 Tax=Streptomyces zhihengii TaxID=1818004 RepID=UPI0033A43C3B